MRFAPCQVNLSESTKNEKSHRKNMAGNQAQSMPGHSGCAFYRSGLLDLRVPVASTIHENARKKDHPAGA